MSLLYPNEGKEEISVSIEHRPDGTIEVIFTDNGGKFGTDEILDFFKFASVKTFLEKVRQIED